MRVPLARRLVCAEASIVFRRDGFDDALLSRVRLTRNKVCQATRPSGCGDLESVAAVVLERDGSFGRPLSHRHRAATTEIDPRRPPAARRRCDDPRRAPPGADGWLAGRVAPMVSAVLSAARRSPAVDACCVAATERIARSVAESSSSETSGGERSVSAVGRRGFVR